MLTMYLQPIDENKQTHSKNEALPVVGDGDRLAKSTLPQFATRDGHTPPAPESCRRLLVVVSSRKMSVHAKNVISWEPARPSGPLGGPSR